MRLDQLLLDLHQVLIEFPKAHIELGFCSCCIQIWIEDKNIVNYNVQKQEFEYLQVLPPFEGQEDMIELLAKQIEKGKNK